MAALTTLNYVNVVAYIVNTAVTFLIGTFGLFGIPTTTELSVIYSTLITPAGWTFRIWPVIFISQAIYIVTQLFGAYRGSDAVTKNVGFNYVAVCLFQAGWILAFGMEIIWLAYLLILGVLFFLLIIVRNQYKSTSEKKSILDYFLLDFPFQIHCGWLCVASLLNLSNVLVAYDADTSVQYGVALISVLSIVLLSVWYLTKPVYVPVLAFAWASFGISSKLGDASELIKNAFSEGSLNVLQKIVFTVGILEVLATIATFVYNQYKSPPGTVGERTPLVV
mmetsp:Transcript_38614/g.44077  ORF Transcript_38614/g.44077 Transcript_38614/m.44077 type:complete len:279 (+) Transcript_38614:141-977(+)|eukprot:CAMPEP_0194130150 /NCGR_PEP_ID=MMETSP0152-20130528/1264_1 /TAXON_ID=1049557 /ORGANISM="Thalassiothrix antarctica, Strain L6-D1" /LENGTH=278 /DNA_ID=CAMNT_0038824575 /DNA_START=92 /DNA_END=928 /DNA_ORIENTATION=-